MTFAHLVFTSTGDADENRGAVSAEASDQSGRNILTYEESHALVIGVSRYDHWRTLPGVQHDVSEITKITKVHNFNVEVLMDPHAETLKNGLEVSFLKKLICI